MRRDGALAGPRSFADFQLNPDAAPLVAALKDSGWLVFVITNQPDIARGNLKRAELDRMMDEVRSRVKPDDIRVCPHDDPDACECRKPKPGMLHSLRDQWRLDLAGSFVIGDTWRDMEAGRSAGCRTILLASPDTPSDVPADWRIRTLPESLSLVGSCAPHT